MQKTLRLFFGLPPSYACCLGLPIGIAMSAVTAPQRIMIPILDMLAKNMAALCVSIPLIFLFGHRTKAVWIAYSLCYVPVRPH